MKKNKNKKSDIKKLQEICHEIAIKKGFWSAENSCPRCFGLGFIKWKAYRGKHVVCPFCKGTKKQWKNRNKSELLMLIVSELGEACEALRRNDRKNFAEELADTVIRILDCCEAFRIDLNEEIHKKIRKNKKRKYKHGKAF